MMARTIPRDPEVVRLIQKCIDDELEQSHALAADEDLAYCRKLFGGNVADDSIEVHESPIVQASRPPSVSADDGEQCAASSQQDDDGLQHWSTDQFEVERILGAGSFGVVFAVREIAEDRRVALKLLRPSLLVLPNLRKRFLREALTVRELRCDGIVRTLDVGMLDTVPAIITELVDGPNLQQYLDSSGGFLAEAEAIQIVAEVARSLHYMHERGVLHRDLKPANILLKTSSSNAASERKFCPMIADFGLAKQFDAQSISQVTASTGQYIVGTLHYMAPEQVQGRNEDVSISSDMYSLGAILYECLVGIPPVSGRSYIEVLTAIVQEKVVPVRKLKPIISHDVELVLQKVLATRPVDRYATVAEFAADLENILIGGPIIARKPSSLRSLAVWARQNPALASLSGLLVVLVCVTSLMFAMLYYRERQAVARFKDLMESSLASVKTHVNVAERELGNTPNSAEQRYQLHKSGLAVLESMMRGLDYNAESRHRLSVQYSYLATAAIQTHRVDEAIEYRLQCIKLLDDLLRVDPTNVDYLYDHFYNQKCLADESWELPLEQFLEKQSKVLLAIQSLREIQPNSADFQDAEAAVHFKIGVTQVRTQPLLAKESLEKAVNISDSLFEQHPTKLLYSKYAITARAALADLSRLQNDLNRAEVFSLEGVHLVESIRHPNKGEYWFLYLVREPFRSYAATMVRQGRWADSETALQRCLEIETQLHDFDPQNITFTLGKAEYLGELLRVRRKRGVPADDTKLLAELDTQIAEWEATGDHELRLSRLRELIRNPDAEAIEAGCGALFP